MRVSPLFVVGGLVCGTVCSTSAAAQVDVTQLTADPRPPERRSSGAALQPFADREHMFTFGGFAAGTLGDMWRLDTQALTWSEVSDVNAPLGRDQHGLDWDASQQRVIMFGGVRQQGISITHMNEVWSFNPTTSTWAQMTANTPAPTGRSSAAFFYIPHRGDFIVFGGWDVRPTFPFGTAGGHFGDTWRLDVNATAATATWTQVTPTGATPGPSGKPTARAATCGAYDEARHKLVLFAGQTGLDAQSNGITSDETWELDVDTLVWTKVTTTNTPQKRSFCGAAFDADANRLLVYGGQDGTAILDGVVAYDPATATWSNETTDIAMPTISDAAGVFSPHLGAMILFGGRIADNSGASVYDDETYLLDLQLGGPPVCSAGPTQNANEGDVVTLDGTASSDPDGASLAFAWTQLTGTVVTLENAATATPTFTAPTITSDEALTFRLSIDDGLDTATCAVTVNVNDAFNDPPVAAAGQDTIVVQGALVTLDGSASSDPDGDALSFAWLQIGGPAVVLDDPTSPAPQFIAPAASGQLEFSLVVDDGTDASIADFVSVVVTDASNAPPVAVAGLDRDAAPGVDVTLDGSASSDANGNVLSFEWTQLSGPTVALDDASAPSPVFTSPIVLVDAPIVLRLVVSDGVFTSAPDDVTVTVRTALGAPRFASLPRNIAVTADAYSYDVDDAVAATGTGTRFTLVSGPPGMTVDADSGLLSWTPDVAGTFAVEIAADNLAGEDTQRFDVDVYAPPAITSTPLTIFDLGRPYIYDEDALTPGQPDVVGSGPMSWSLVEGPAAMVVEVATGHITWTALFPDAVTVRLRVENAFGADEQEFTLSRPPETVPRIARSANLFAAVGRSYVYDDDRAVGIENLRPGDITVVAPRAPVPSGMFVVPQVSGASPLYWRPENAGVTSIGLALISIVGVPLDFYEFDVDVVNLDPEGLARADAQASPTSGPAPLTVSFDGRASRGSSGVDGAATAPLYVYAWSTGDGAVAGNIAPVGTAAVSSAQHTYSAPGSYTAELQVEDAYGVFSTDKVTISVLDGTKQPPTARIVADVLEGRDQLTVRFSCDCADPDGGALAGVLWSYGDGTTSTALSPTHTYVQPGQYHTRLTTFDADGLTGTDSVDVRVRAGDLAPPLARIAASPGSEGNQPMNVVLEASTGDDDGVVVAVRWSLPDGSVRTGSRVETTFPTPGYFPVLLEAEDNDGLIGRDILTISVNSDGVRPPLVVSQPAASARTAVVGVPWRYDADGRANAQGGRPIIWRVGKTVDGERVNAPAGMEVTVDGLLEWTPTDDQVGEQRVTLVAENTAGNDLQELVVTVLANPRGPQGCGCTSDGNSAPGAAVPFVLLGLGLLRRRQRRARVEMLAVTIAFVAFAASSTLAAPSFTSSAPAIASAGTVFEYQAAATGEGLVAYDLVEGPAGMVVDAVDGSVLWMPTKRETVNVVVHAADRTGVVEQRFTLDVAGGTPAAFDFAEPPGGFVFRTDIYGTIEPGIYLVPSVGDEPKQFYADTEQCMFMLVNGGALFHRANESSCAPTLYVANPWGREARTVNVNFVEPPTDEKLFLPLLSASVLEGPAPLLVTFDGTASRIPQDEEWAVTVVFHSGEADGELLDSDPASMITEYVYTEPGVYTATLTVLAHDTLASLVSVLERSQVTIVVADEGVRPPSTTLVPDVAAGPSPHSVAFSSTTVQSDAPIVAYALDFGDGAAFEVTTSAFGSFAEPSPTHVYSAPGNYRATLRVVDAVGREARAETEIVVRAGDGSPPSARIIAFPARGEVPLTVTLAAEVTDGDGYLVSQTWVLPGGAVSAEANPSFVVDEPGEHTVELIVRDDSGLETRARTSVAATRDGVLPPRVVSVPNRGAVAGEPWRYDEDSTVSVTGGGPYRFALGKVIGDGVVNAPDNMTIDERTGAIAWTPALDTAIDVTVEVPVSVLVENAAGATLHEFVLDVEPPPSEADPIAPASCASSSAAQGALAGLALLLLVRRRRVSR